MALLHGMRFALDLISLLETRLSAGPAALRSSDKVLMTSTVLLNDTLDDVLAHCRQAKAVAMVGPGAGCLPQPLFDRGVTTVGGTWITDAAGFADALRSGVPWGRFARKVVWQR